ncbi:MAG TPA: hypothetical protein VIL32_03505 [Steroidobacteraceae bacterium]
MLVIKFGGTSLASPARIRRAARRVAIFHRAGRRPVVVVSAMGHTTDRLLNVLMASTGNDTEGAAREIDRALATGEDFSAAALAAALIAISVPAVSLRGGEAGLLATGSFGSGVLQQLQGDRLLSLVEAGIVPVVAGFQAARTDGQTVTLGRGGSDTSAVFIAAQLRARSCHIVTDVEGVFDADPNVRPDARLLPALSTAQLVDLTERGALVVHPHAARLAHEHRVPLRIYHHSARPGSEGGTFVTAEHEAELKEAV